MALKFLNKKGWHTGSLRNIENVWKAEQKHEAEQKKLEELRKQIQDEREQSEFRRLQEESGLLPKQERLDFLYDSGLSVRKSSNADGSSGVEFKAFEESIPANNSSNINNNNAPPSSSSAKQPSIPGALFEDKPYSSNDAWRKLHSDPLLLIRQREQEALARVKNNPVQMALIHKSVEATKEKENGRDKKERRKKHSHGKEKHDKQSSKPLSDSENDSAEREKRRKSRVHKSSKYDERHKKARLDSDCESSERENQRRGNSYRSSKNRELSPSGFSCPKAAENDGHAHRKHHNKSTNEKYSSKGGTDFDVDRKERDNRSSRETRPYNLAEAVHYKRRNVAPKLTEEERATRLQEMKMDAELHEERRWKRLRKAEEDDAREATRASILGGRNFLDAAHKSVYGAEKGGSSTIEESVRRRTHYLQGKSEAGDGNAFRR